MSEAQGRVEMRNAQGKRVKTSMQWSVFCIKKKELK